MSKYKAIRIDPFQRQVYEVDILCTESDQYGLEAIRELVGTDNLGHMMLDQHTTDWHDDIGLYVSWDQQAFFRAKWYPTPLCGIHVIVGCRWGYDEEGIPTDFPADVALTADAVRAALTWITPQEVVVPAPQMNGVTLAGTNADDKGNWTYERQPARGSEDWL